MTRKLQPEIDTDTLGSWTDGRGAFIQGRPLGHDGKEVMVVGRDGLSFCTRQEWDATIAELVTDGWVR